MDFEQWLRDAIRAEAEVRGEHRTVVDTTRRIVAEVEMELDDEREQHERAERSKEEHLDRARHGITPL